MATAGVTEVRDRLSEIVDEVVATGTEFVITRHGRPAVVLVSYDEYEGLVETLNILSDDDTVAAINEGLSDLNGPNGT
jgi:prevent-host-death family protein